MKRFIVFLLLLVSVQARAATPAFTDFQTTQFNVVGNKVNLRTNLPVGSLTVTNGLAVAGTGTFDSLVVTNGITSLLAGASTFDAITVTNEAIFTGSAQLPNGAAPTTDAFGEIAADNNAWAASRGAPQFFDGTANTYLLGALASDTPSNGQVPTWNTGGTITWETSSGAGDFVGPAASTDNSLLRFNGTTGKLGKNSSGATLSDNMALTLASPAVTASEPVLKISQTFNNAGVLFTGMEMNFTNTASAAGTMALNIKQSGTSVASVLRNGVASFASVATATTIAADSGYTIGWTGSTLFAPPPANGAVKVTTSSATKGYTIGGTLKTDTTTTGNVGAGEDDLVSFSIPAGQLTTNGDYIAFDVFGTFANNSNTAQVKLFFDGASFFDTTSLLFGSTSLIWRATGKIIRTGATTQKIEGDFGISGTLLGALTTTTRFYATDTATLSGATIFKVTGQDTGGVPADNKVVQEGMILQYFSNN